MNDAALVREAVESLLDYAGTSRGHDSDAKYEADRLTALADRLETHALVPREPTPDMNIKGAFAIAETLPDSATYVDTADACYRAMLAASEAK